MQASNKKTNNALGKILSKVKETIANELTTIILSLIISAIVCITVCLPISKFISKNYTSMYGLIYEGLLTLRYKITPISAMLICSFLIGYIFNKSSIKKMYFINKYSKNYKYTFKNFISRFLYFIVLLVGAFILIGSSDLDVTNTDIVLSFLYKDAIIYAAVLSALSTYVLFFGISKMYKEALMYNEKKEKQAQKKREKQAQWIQRNKVKSEFKFKYIKLTTKYSNIFKNILKDTKMHYNNSDLYDILNSNEKDRHYNLTVVKNGDFISYNKSKAFIEYGTNEDKYFNFKNQVRNIRSKYGDCNSEHLSSYFDDKLNVSKINECLNTINSINNSFIDELLDERARYALKKVEGHLKCKNAMSDDFKKYIKLMIDYIFKYYPISKRGYFGELRVMEELKKYSDQFISINNKCFNFSYIDFIPDSYTMECDNIVITQRGVFVIETKNNMEDSIYIDKKTGKAYDKCSLHIESDGRWLFEENDKGFKQLKKTPIEQNREHMIKLEKIINHHLGYDRFDKEYIEVKSIIVMANDNLKIRNDFKGPVDVCRPNYIYEAITKHPKNEFFTRDMINKIVNIINSYDRSIHKPVLYSLVNIEKELNSLYHSAYKIFNDGVDINKINYTLKNYQRELNELNVQYNKKMNNIR